MERNDADPYERSFELQRQIDSLVFNQIQLDKNVQEATSKAMDNEEKLVKLMEQITRMDGTILRMRTDLPTKSDLDTALNTTLNKHIAKGFWTALALGLGAFATWLVNNIRIG